MVAMIKEFMINILAIKYLNIIWKIDIVYNVANNYYFKKIINYLKKLNIDW